MYRVLAEEEERHRVEDDDGRTVGWIHGRTIGFRGFDDEARALHAAGVAWRALDRVLRREFAGWPRHEPAYDRLHIANDERGEWITDGQWTLARVLRFDRTPRGAAPLALEFQLPSYAREGVAVAAAQLMGVALGEMIARPPVLSRSAEAAHAADATDTAASIAVR